VIAHEIVCGEEQALDEELLWGLEAIGAGELGEVGKRERAHLDVLGEGVEGGEQEEACEQERRAHGGGLGDQGGMIWHPGWLSHIVEWKAKGAASTLHVAQG
jgi:hypothetical protein